METGDINNDKKFNKNLEIKWTQRINTTYQYHKCIEQFV